MIPFKKTKAPKLFFGAFAATETVMKEKRRTMMIAVNQYLERLTDKLKECFSKRLLYVGLQGSYLREEADENSDIDVMVLVDGLSPEDLRTYRKIIQEMSESDKACGFLCGKEEMRHWNPLEICHLLHTTKDYYGTLRDYTPKYTLEDEQNYVKVSLNNLFHEICHRYLYGSQEKNVTSLPYSYKAVFFLLQNIHYLETGEFLLTKQDLLAVLKGRDREVLEKSTTLRNEKNYDFEEAYQLLFQWCQEMIRKI
jgi:predicted nucleotidyltransferase